MCSARTATRSARRVSLEALLFVTVDSADCEDPELCDLRCPPASLVAVQRPALNLFQHVAQSPGMILRQVEDRGWLVVGILEHVRPNHRIRMMPQHLSDDRRRESLFVVLQIA